MKNIGLIKKMKKDMHMRNFSKYTYDSYLLKTKDIMRYFGDKQLENVTTDELRDFLLKYLKNERKLSDRSINYYNSVIRFIYEVTLDKVINKKQLPMRKQKKTVYKVLTKEELGAFFNCVDNYKYITIFMLAYGSGLRIGEITNLQVEDIDGKTMRVFVREGKGNNFLKGNGVGLGFTGATPNVNGVTNLMRNPSQSGIYFWLCSGNSSTAANVYIVGTFGGFNDYNYGENRGVRPIIIIEY